MISIFARLGVKHPMLLHGTPQLHRASREDRSPLPAPLRRPAHTAVSYSAKNASAAPTSSSCPRRKQPACHAQPQSAAPTSSATSAPPSTAALKTLTQFAAVSGCPDDLVIVMGALQTAAKVIGSKVARAAIEQLTGAAAAAGGASSSSSSSGGDRDKQKKLDVVSNEVMVQTLAATGKVAVLASEEDDDAILVDDRAGLVVVFDPLDGSSNIDCNIPTGTIFGVYRRTAPQPGQSPAQRAAADAQQPGDKLVAAGYALYSGATNMVVSFGRGTHGFTLDPQAGEFLLTHPSMRMPPRGQFYSLNDARYFDWPHGLRTYIDAIRQGKGQSGKQYSARYVCSLVADFHRTLLYGGWAANPRAHLRLVYEANPLAFLAEQAGGRGSDGKQRILSIPPAKLHQRLPLFLGSADDIAELESYGDVQQTGKKKYEV